MYGICCTEDARLVVSADGDGLARIWDLETFRETRSWKAHEMRIWSATLTPDESGILTSSEDKTTRIWTLEGDLLQTLEHDWFTEVVAMRAGARGAHPHSDGERVLTWTGLGLTTWNIESGEAIRALGEMDDPLDLEVAVAEPAGKLLGGSPSGVLELRDFETWELVVRQEAHEDWINGVALASDGRIAVTGGRDHTVKIWDLERRSPEHSPPAQGSIAEIVVNPSGAYLASADLDGNVLIWDADALEPCRRLEVSSQPLRSLDSSADGRKLAVISEFGEVQVWESEAWIAEGGRASHSVEIGKYNGQAVALRPDGRQLLFDDGRADVKVWDLEADRAIGLLKGQSRGVRCLRYSVSGTHAVSGSEDGTVRIWDLETSEARVLEGHEDWVQGVAISPDGRWLASASLDATIKVWSWKTGELRATLRGHAGFVHAVSWFPDSQRLASASYDYTARIWNVETGVVLATFTADASLRACCVLPDGQTVVAGDYGGRLHFLCLE